MTKLTISRFRLSTPACRGKPFQIHGSGFVLFSGADSWRGDTNASGMYPRISGDGHDHRYTPVAGPLRHQIPTAKSRVSARAPRRMGAPAAMVVPVTFRQTSAWRRQGVSSCHLILRELQPTLWGRWQWQPRWREKQQVWREEVWWRKGTCSAMRSL